MFDSTAEIAITARTATGKQLIEMRWPSDDDWCDRAKRRKILIKNLGRGISETTVESGDADLRLFEKVKLNGAPALTEGEATRVVEAISQCDVTGVQLEGEEAVVELQVMGGAVHHRLNLPTADQVIKLRKAVRILGMPYNTQEMRIPLEPGVQLWDACAGKSEDYKGPVPAPHKDTAVRAVIEYLDRETGAANDEANF